MNGEVRRIAVFGPESTGKSELALKLGAHFGAPVVAEYAREFWDAHGAITLGDIPAIAREQWRREDAAAAEAARGFRSLTGYEGARPVPLVVCDTDALTTVLWSDLLYGTTPDEVRRGAEKRCRDYSLYLLLHTDVPWAPDPQRCFPDPDDREKCRRLFHGAVERRGLPYVWIRGDWAARERAAVAAVESVLRTE